MELNIEVDCREEEDGALNTLTCKRDKKNHYTFLTEIQEGGEDEGFFFAHKDCFYNRASA